jgi:hypothetical protein
MLKNLTTLIKKPSQNKVEQLMSLSGAMVLLRKGVTRPGLIGAVSLAVGAYTLYRGIKAYKASHDANQTSIDMATRPGLTADKQENIEGLTTPATPVKSPLG